MITQSWKKEIHENYKNFYPFRQPHYLLLDLAIVANGGDLSKSAFPVKYVVDWVRVYQNK